MRLARIVTQAVFFAAFIVLLARTEYHGRDVIAYPVRIFLQLDPLILLTTLLSSHALVKALLWSLVVVAATLVLGRVFCGWVCPLGALNDFAGSFKRTAASPTRLDAVGTKVKYYVLAFVLAASIFGLHLVGILDPISLVIRSFALAVMPAVNLLARAVLGAVYDLGIPGLNDAAGTLLDSLELHVLSFRQPFFVQASLIGALLAVVLALNFLRKRFWCRFICPLGALLALVGRFSLLNHRLEPDSCDECRLCMTTCNAGARPEPSSPWRGSECVLCMNCRDTCPIHAISFEFGRPEPGMHRTDLERRYVLGSAVAAVGSLLLLRLNPVGKTGNADLVRPPGSLGEDEFLRRCVKCGECMKVCITNGLQPTFLQAGFEGIWSPVFDFRIGYCEYNCTLCGQVCPTQAIERLDPETKKKRKIGLAFIDINRCLPYAFHLNCIVCEEHCPTDPKAITFERETVETADGPVEIKKPVIDPKICTGCGICEYKCPVGQRAAVRVSSIGEDRSEENRILL